MGITFFDQMNEYFKDNYDVLMEDFVRSRKPDEDPATQVK